MAADPQQLIILLIQNFFVIFAGLVLGSFATAVAYRVPRGIPWAFQSLQKPGSGKKPDTALSAYRSACPQCARRLGIADLIPVLSWLFLRGRCRSCKAAIPLRYPLIELGVVLSLFIAYSVHGIGWEFLFIAISIPFLWSLVAIDLEYLILPDQLVAILAALGGLRLLHGVVMLDMSAQDVAEYLAGAVFFAGFIWFLGWVVSKALKKEALGFGDVKFFGVAGLWLGIGALAPFALLSGVLGVFLALIWRIFKGQEVFPFGPALIAAFFILLLVGGSHFLKII